jgi:hypothetical protein
MLRFGHFRGLFRGDHGARLAGLSLSLTKEFQV